MSGEGWPSARRGPARCASKPLGWQDELHVSIACVAKHGLPVGVVKPNAQVDLVDGDCDSSNGLRVNYGHGDKVEPICSRRCDRVKDVPYRHLDRVVEKKPTASNSVSAIRGRVRAIARPLPVILIRYAAVNRPASSVLHDEERARGDIEVDIRAGHRVDGLIGESLNIWSGNGKDAVLVVQHPRGGEVLADAYDCLASSLRNHAFKCPPGPLPVAHHEGAAQVWHGDREHVHRSHKGAFHTLRLEPQRSSRLLSDRRVRLPIVYEVRGERVGHPLSLEER